MGIDECICYTYPLFLLLVLLLCCEKVEYQVDLINAHMSHA